MKINGLEGEREGSGRTGVRIGRGQVTLQLGCKIAYKQSQSHLQGALGLQIDVAVLVRVLMFLLAQGKLVVP